MKLTKETLRRIIKEELEESRLRKHLGQNPRVKEIINHPLTKLYLKAYFGTLTGDEWSNQPPNAKLSTSELNEFDLMQKIEKHPDLAAGDSKLAAAVIDQMMKDGTLDEEFLLAANHQKKHYEQ